MGMGVVINKLVAKRIKERFGLNKSASIKLTEKAFEYGVQYDNTTGRLKSYLDSLLLSHGSENDIRIYNDRIFIFHYNVLKTFFNLPHKFVPEARWLQSHNRKTDFSDLSVHHQIIKVPVYKDSHEEVKIIGETVLNGKPLLTILNICGVINNVRKGEIVWLPLNNIPEHKRMLKGADGKEGSCCDNNLTEVHNGNLTYSLRDILINVLQKASCG